MKKNELKITTVFTVFILVLLFFGSETQAQYNFSKKSYAEAWAFAGKFESEIIKGSYIGGVASLTQAPSIKKNTTLYGLKIEGVKYSYEGKDKVWVGKGQGNFGSIGLTMERRNLSKNRTSIFRLSSGGKVLNIKEVSDHDMSHKSSQHTLLYGEMWWMTFHNRQAFNRLDFGLRYEHQLMASGDIWQNGKTQQFDADKNDRGSFSMFSEVSLLTFPIDVNWGIVFSIRGEYKHENFNKRDLYSPMGVISVYNNYSDILRLSIGREFFPQKSEYKDNVNISVDVFNVVRGMGNF
ncbi:MAG: hypothetical protein QY321_02685 [Patescibacteria group bacterium]|nr:MAG: hypothetical protein QY321_02685 [Patescibacteria group bacterium]